MRWLLALMLVPYALGLGSVGLFESEETRYAQMAKEMAESGDWLVPRLEGVPYLEKPPLTVWATVLVFKAFGVSEFSARVVPLLCALLMLVFTYCIARRIAGERHALIACIVLAGSPLFFGMGRILTTDSPFALALLVAMDALLAIREQRSFVRQAQFGLGLAAALLTKGPLGIALIGLGVAAIAWVDRSWRFLFEPLQPVSLLLTLGFSLPWFFWVQQRYPEFFDFFVLRHHFERFLGSESLDRDLHEEPLHYYLPIAMTMSLPWVIWVGAARRRVATFPDPRPLRALWLWALAMFVFFSLSSGKRVAYLLPLAAPWAVILALAWGEIARRRLRLVCAFVGVCGVAVSFALPRIEEKLSFRPMAAEMKIRTLDPNRQTFVFPSYFPGVSFYLGQGIPVLGSLGELDFGMKIDPRGAAIPADCESRGERLLFQPGALRILGRRKHLERMLPKWSQHAQFRVLAKNEEWMIIEN